MYDPRTHFFNTYDRQNHRDLNTGSENFIEDVFRPDNHQESMEGDDSGVCSPPLWKNHPSPPKSPSEPLLLNHNYRSLSPNSRTQAIVRGQWELMEMVKNMPESSYELTLKDLVENPTTYQTERTSPRYERSSRNLQQRGGVKVKKHENNVIRSGSLENRGLFLNMVFPVSLKSKKKKGFGRNNSDKVSSPKPEMVKGVAERDWWKKRFTGSSDSDSSRMSGSSGSSGSGGSSASSGGRSNSDTRTRNGFLSGCWPCFFKSKRDKNQ